MIRSRKSFTIYSTRYVAWIFTLALPLLKLIRMSRLLLVI